MKTAFAIIITFIGFIVFGQENNLNQIDNEVNFIESDSTLKKTEFNLVELTGINTDGGGILKVWTNKKQLCKIVEEIGFSYGRIRTTIYIKNEIPIKIIQTEENFIYQNGELNNKVLNEVFKVFIYVIDWKNDNSQIEHLGKRVLSEGSCSIFDYKPTVELAKKAIIK